MPSAERVAYADPPYVGQAKRHYQSEEVDHVQLIQKLQTYKAWALSCSSPSLPTLLPMCPNGIRIGAWVKPFAIFKPNVNPTYAWEPIIYVSKVYHGKAQHTIRDWVSCNITLKRGLVGVKPDNFCFWLFELLGMTKEDELDDLFPGTGAVTKAWENWRKQDAVS